MKAGEEPSSSRSASVSGLTTGTGPRFAARDGSRAPSGAAGFAISLVLAPHSACSCSSSRAASIGFARKASAPASRHSRFASGVASAESTTTGSRARAPAVSRIACTVSMPLSRGMLRSISAMSNCEFSSASSARSPSETSVAEWPPRSRIRASTSRLVGLSSATRTCRPLAVPSRRA